MALTRPGHKERSTPTGRLMESGFGAEVEGPGDAADRITCRPAKYDFGGVLDEFRDGDITGANSASVLLSLVIWLAGWRNGMDSMIPSIMMHSFGYSLERGSFLFLLGRRDTGAKWPYSSGLRRDPHSYSRQITKIILLCAHESL